MPLYEVQSTRITSISPTTFATVNNAGSSAAGPFEQVTGDAWRGDLGLKLMPSVLLARLCIPEMR